MGSARQQLSCLACSTKFVQLLNSVFTPTTTTLPTQLLISSDFKSSTPYESIFDSKKILIQKKKLKMLGLTHKFLFSSSRLQLPIIISLRTLKFSLKLRIQQSKAQIEGKMVTKTVDLRSDTVKKPTEAMRAAMANAKVDDDVLGSDPTAERFDEEMAKIMGKEAALFVPSGTMGNHISVLVHCEVRGSEVILGDNSHINIYENGGISTIGGVRTRTVKNNSDGTMDLALIKAATRDPEGELYYPTTRLICLENTHANAGGRSLFVEYTDKVGALAKTHGLKLHIDGVRILNVSVVKVLRDEDL